MPAQNWMSRRTFLKSTALVGVAVGVAACVPAAPAAPAATGEGAAAPNSAASKELTLMHWDNENFGKFNKGFEDATGAKINYAAFPSGAWTDVMQKFALWSQTGDSAYDLTIADDLIAGMMAANGYATDLGDTDAWMKNKDDVVEGVHGLNKILGGVYRIFYLLDLEPFFYYKDLVPNPPKNWSDLVTAAKPVTNPDTDVWGWRPLNGAGHEFNTILLLLNQAGANLDTLDDPATLDAFKFMADWVFKDEITPKSTVNEGYDQINNLTAQGKAGMWWTYTGGYRNALKTENSLLTMDNSTAARWPMGPASDGGLMHGWGWMVPKSAGNKDMAVEYLNWFAQPDVMKQYVITVLQDAPAYKTLIHDPDVVAVVPTLGMPVGWETLLEGANFRAPIVTKKPVNELWNLFQNIGKFLFSGEKSPEQTQEWAVGEYKRIMADAG
jgi:ABC-type glycerol-3-phosphate transport system substrate-binding protein